MTIKALVEPINRNKYEYYKWAVNYFDSPEVGVVSVRFQNVLAATDYCRARGFDWAYGDCRASK